MLKMFAPMIVLYWLLAVGLSSVRAEEPEAFRRGINLARIHSLPAEDPYVPGDFLWPPFQGPLTEISDSELRRLKTLGFDFVRLPVAPAPFLSATKTKHDLLMDALYATIDRLQSMGFAVIVDAHPNHHDAYWSAPEILAGKNGPAFQAYAAWLQKLAADLSKLPPAKTALELMNEPQVECYRENATEWTELQPVLYAAVRDRAPSLKVVLTTGCWSSPDALPYLDMAGYDENTLIDVHYYRPHMFTHQGLPFTNIPTRFLSGLPYPASREGRTQALARSKQLIDKRKDQGVEIPWDIDEQLDAALNNYFDVLPFIDENYIDGHFSKIKEWADKQNVNYARIVVGEFGAARPPEGLPEIPGRNLWIENVRKAAETRGFGWAYWEYNAGDGYPGMGLVYDNDRRKIDQKVTSALGLPPTK